MSDKPDFGKAQKKAEQILKDNFITSPPVRISAVVGKYGISVVETDLSFTDSLKNIEGVVMFGDHSQKQTAEGGDMEQVPEIKYVLLNDSISDEQKVFATAFLFGHWILHEDKIRVLSEQSPKTLMSKSNSPIGQINDELAEEALYFAAHLLMPEKLLKDYEGDSKANLATIFGVPEEVVGFRLSIR